MTNLTDVIPLEFLSDDDEFISGLTRLIIDNQPPHIEC
jgi:hypothetical protein